MKSKLIITLVWGLFYLASNAQQWDMSGPVANTQNPAQLNTGTSFPISLRTNGSERMTIQPTGHVGIGTATSLTTPRTLLMVADNTSVNGNDGTYRNWMRVGTYYQEDSDHMYVGLDDNATI